MWGQQKKKTRLLCHFESEWSVWLLPVVHVCLCVYSRVLVRFKWSGCYGYMYMSSQCQPLHFTVHWPSVSQYLRDVCALVENIGISPLCGPRECKVCLLLSGSTVFPTLARPPLSRRMSGAILHERTTQKTGRVKEKRGILIGCHSH